MSQVTITIREQSFTGEVSDMDSLFFAGLLMPDYSEVLKEERGLTDSFRKFTAEHSAMVALASGDNKDRVMEKISETWSERVLIRLTNNLEIRAAFAQRVREIFPDLPTQWVNYQRWKDGSGNIHENCSVRLGVTEIMGIITPVSGTLTEEPSSPTPAPMSTPAPVSAPAPEGQAAYIASLEDQLRAAQSRLAQSKPEGFGK